MNDIQKAIIFYDGNGDMPYCDLVYESLKKRFPMKPLKPDGRYYGKAKGGFCPACGAHTNSIAYNYCRKCGQALDWSGDGE